MARVAAARPRLALAVAAGIADGLRDGGLWIDLTTLSDGRLLAQVVAGSAGLVVTHGSSTMDTLLQHLSPRQALLCLDNCEHLTAPCADLALDLLNHCPDLKILATSRVALGVIGEMIYRVPPLPLPARGAPLSISSALESAAVQLFVERAAAVRQGFALKGSNLAAVIGICERLDGLPLGIELAAAQTRVLAPAQILDQLDDRLASLGAGSHSAGLNPRSETLWGSLNWSHSLLDAEERVLFRRLAVFMGSFSLAAAEAICALDSLLPGPVLPVLARLVDNSLVLVEVGGSEARYRLLETIRTYADEKLVEAGERARMQECHLDFYLALAEAEVEDQRARTRLPGEDAGNLRAALLLSLEPSADVQKALRLAAAMSWLRLWGGLHEIRTSVERILARPEAAGHSLARAKVLNGAGFLAWWQQDWDVAEARLLESTEICHELLPEAAGALGVALSLLGLLSIDRHDTERARAYYEESVTWLRSVNNVAEVARSLRNLGETYRMVGQTTQARELLVESLQMARSTEDPSLITRVLRSFAFLSAAEGDHSAQCRYHREELAGSAAAGDRWGVMLALRSLASIEVERNARAGAEAAAALWGQTEVLSREFGVPVIPPQHEDYERELAAARKLLGSEAFDWAWAQGSHLTFGQAAAYGLERLDALLVTPEPVESATSGRQAAKRQFGGLTTRERELAGLVAQGLSNRQIAERLVLSERTVTTHITNILTKLNLKSRTQIAVWAQERGLLEKPAGREGSTPDP